MRPLSQPPTQTNRAGDAGRSLNKGQELHIKAKSQINREMRNELLGTGKNKLLKLLFLWYSSGRPKAGVCGCKHLTYPPFPLQTSGFFFSPLAQQQWRRRVSECGGRGADWLPTPEQWILLPFIWFQFRRRVREGEGGGSGLPLYQTVTAFFTTSLTPSFWFLVYQGCGVGTSPSLPPSKDSWIHPCTRIVSI